MKNNKYIKKIINKDGKKQNFQKTMSDKMKDIVIKKDSTGAKVYGSFGSAKKVKISK